MQGRTEQMDDNKARYAQTTEARTLADAIAGADVFLGLSAGGVLKPEMVQADGRTSRSSWRWPIPTPEILPEEVKAVRPDAIIATGRSDYPNQVNNVLCFPFIFRGALDVGATTINEEMKLAAVRAIADLAQAEQSDDVAAGLRRRESVLRPRIPDPQALRSAPDHQDRAGGGAGRDGFSGVADAADRRPGCLSRTAVAVRLPLRHGDEAGVQLRQEVRRNAWSMPKAKTSACCAPSQIVVDEGLATDPGRPARP